EGPTPTGHRDVKARQVSARRAAESRGGHRQRRLPTPRRTSRGAPRPHRRPLTNTRSCHRTGVPVLCRGMPSAPATQRSFDDLGTPLCDVTFVVLDLETTGGSPHTCGITEVGALKFRGGECLGTFQTLVTPGVPLPPEITYLTGITEAMVLPAPPIEQVLPQFLE